jgi:glyoxylase-like metal-dependent hydrolase (beta-lactamase superfamily II)
VSAVLLTAPAAAQAAPSAAHSTHPGHHLDSDVALGFVIGDAAVVGDGDAARVEVPMLTDGRRTTVVTEPVDKSDATGVADALAPGALVDYEISRGLVVVPDKPAETFHTALTKGARPVFDMQRYGPELAPRDGQVGDMVAAGWVYGKDERTITMGDGRVVTEDIAGRRLPKPSKRYEETYRVSRDVDVYEVNTSDWSASGPSTYDAVPVTASYDYAETERQAAFVVFDRSFRQARSAKVREIYYFTPADTSDGKPVWDVPTQSDLLKDKGVDPISGERYGDIVATGVSSAPYTRSTEPFELVPDTIYYVGDNEVSLYLFHADMGTDSLRDDKLVLVDSGWPNSGYQYWKNIEAMGYDPRDIDVVIMSHGHGDHYGTMVELMTMIENAGGQIDLLSPEQDVEGLTHVAVGNTWDIALALPAFETEIRENTGFIQDDEWMAFGNVRLLPIWTPGHTPGATSFVFGVKNPETGKRLTFGYMGGYGWGPKTVSPTNGWQRLAFVYTLSWLQQRVHPDYVAPQHAKPVPAGRDLPGAQGVQQRASSSPPDHARCHDAR